MNINNPLSTLWKDITNNNRNQRIHHLSHQFTVIILFYFLSQRQLHVLFYVWFGLLFLFMGYGLSEPMQPSKPNTKQTSLKEKRQVNWLSSSSLWRYSKEKNEGKENETKRERALLEWNFSAADGRQAAYNPQGKQPSLAKKRNPNSIPILSISFWFIFFNGWKRN